GEVDGEGDDEGIESNGEGDLEKVESSWESDVGEVQADGEGVSATSIEVDKDIGMESGGHISLGSTDGENNDSEVTADEYAGDFVTSDGVDNIADEYAGDFTTSDRLDNVVASRSGEEEDGNDTEVWDSDEHGSLVGSNEDEEHEDGKRKKEEQDGKQFKSAIRKYSKECRRQLKFIKNEPKRVVLRCIASPNFLWRIRASYSPVAKCLQIKTFQDEAKKIVKEKMAGNDKKEFGLLWDYAHELRSKMPRSTIKMAVQRVKADSLPHFKRYYVCFDALKSGWKTGCRPLIRLDGCFLKGSFKNEFLTAVGIHANNQMFPIAWGFEITIPDILPRVEHRNCARHVFANGSGRKLGKFYECDFWQIVKCTTERVWEDLCSTLEKKNKDAYDNLMKKSPKMWTRAFLWTTCKTNIVDNNLCEAFNSIIVEARFKSIIRMLEDIRTKMMTRIVQKRKLCNRWKQNYGPLVKAKFDANKKDCVEWQLIWSGENGCELRKGSYQYTVDLSQRICSCKSWQINGIPCSHACAALYHLGLQPDEYLHEYYHNDTYKKAYSFSMHPINGPYDWEKTGIQPVLPPIEKKMLGRPKKNRRMAKDEPKKLKLGHLRRKGLLMTCTQCDQHDHNKRPCPNSK
ncbi:hypothetical protein Gogos_004581, partial [Gossypium gossypioides]|nr:hypothetical protein [Gossypium gossypioides]